MNPSSLYVHIPFCRHICAYCDFPKVIHREEWVDAYLPFLLQQIASHGPGPYQTIYCGGGTPSCLGKEKLTQLLSYLGTLLAPGGEFSVEANPEDVDEEFVAILLRAKVNRLSLGAQTSSPRLLKLLGRHHDFEAVRKAVATAKRLGLTNLNVDWMYGLPSETEEELNRDIEAFLSLEVPHLSAYSLILEQSTLFSHLGIQEAEEDEQAAQYEKILSSLRAKGYRRYEVSNFALPGHHCRHNLVYWNDERYVGCGLGAAGYEGDIRYKNPVSLQAYLSGAKAEEENITEEDDVHYFFLTNLRKDDGFAIKTFDDRFHKDFLEDYKEEIQKLIADGLATIDNGRFFATDKGLLLLDVLLRALFQ